MTEITKPVGEVAAAAAEAVQDVVDDAQAAADEAERLASIDRAASEAAGVAYDAKAAVEGLRGEMSGQLEEIRTLVAGIAQTTAQAVEEVKEVVTDDIPEAIEEAASDAATAADAVAGGVEGGAESIADSGSEAVDDLAETIETAPERGHWLFRRLGGSGR